MTREAFFESDSIKKLPLDKYYLSFVQEDGNQYIIALITRKHNNGNFSLGLFIIQDTTGEIIGGTYDFKVFPEAIDEFKAQFRLTEYDNKEAVELLVYSAVEQMHLNGIQVHEFYTYAKRIMNTDYDTIMAKASSIELLATFQSRDTPLSEGARSTPQEKAVQMEYEDEDDFNEQEDDNEAFKMLSASFDSNVDMEFELYDPSAVSQWNRTRWEHFMTNELPEVFSQDTAHLINPLIYLFETLFLPILPVDRKITKEIRKLLMSSAKLVTDYLGPDDQLETDSSEQETLAAIRLWELAEELTPASDSKAVMDELNYYIKTYPDNLDFNEILKVVYYNTGQMELYKKTTLSNYDKNPGDQPIFMQYVNEIFDNESSEKERIAAFFQKGYLLEDHFPGISTFDTEVYLNYYLRLALYLLEHGYTAEFWLLHHIISTLPESKLWAKNNPYWYGLYMYPANLILVTIKRSSKAKKSSYIDDILQYQSKDTD